MSIIPFILNPKTKSQLCAIIAGKIMTIPEYQKKWDAIRISHGIFCGVAILFFAISGALLRLIDWKYNIRLHYIIQLFALTLLITGLGTGVWLANQSVWVSFLHVLHGLHSLHTCSFLSR